MLQNVESLKASAPAGSAKRKPEASEHEQAKRQKGMSERVRAGEGACGIQIYEKSRTLIGVWAWNGERRVSTLSPPVSAGLRFPLVVHAQPLHVSVVFHIFTSITSRTVDAEENGAAAGGLPADFFDSGTGSEAVMRDASPSPPPAKGVSMIPLSRV